MSHLTTPPGHVHVTPASARRPAGTGEGTLLAAMALCALATGASAGAPAAVIASAGLLALALVSISGPIAERTRVPRALALVATGTGLAMAEPALMPLCVVISVVAAAAFPLHLSRPNGRWVTVAAAAGIAVPLMGRPFLSTGEPALGLTLGPVTVLALTGMAVVLTAGAVSVAAATTVRDAYGLASRSALDARDSDARLTHQTRHDVLTGLPNREAFTAQAVRALSREDAVGGSVGLLVLEVERFSALSDSIGHAGAQEVLTQVARRLRASRPAHDLVARTGHAQFAVLIEGVGPEGCGGVARRMTALLEEPITAADRDVSLTCSIGVVLSGPGVDTAEELLRAGEEAARAAQAGGRSRWAMFDQAMRAHTVSQATLELELRDTLRRGGVDVVFQPLVRLGADGETERVVALEALARWSRADGSAVPPQRFVPLAEELGLGLVLGFQVLDRALDAFAGWRTADLGIEQVGINVSRSQLEDPDFAHTVSARLAARDLEASVLAVDVRAEDLTDDDQVATTLAMLHSLGVRVCLDDFGRRSSSLSGLGHAPVSLVKIDRSVVQTLSRTDTVARHLVGLCRELGLEMSAEGVETPDELAALRALGVDVAQGYLLGRPVREADLPALLAERGRERSTWLPAAARLS